MKKKNILLLGVLFLSTIGLMAQRYGNFNENGEKYYSQKIAFITDAMDLSPEEAAAFWPLYNDFESKKKDLLGSIGSYRMEIIGRFNELTDDEAREALEVFHSHMKDMNALTIEYQIKYLEVVPAKKVLLLLKAEKDFRRSMLKRLGNRKRGERR